MAPGMSNLAAELGGRTTLSLHPVLNSIRVGADVIRAQIIETCSCIKVTNSLKANTIIDRSIVKLNYRS